MPERAPSSGLERRTPGKQAAASQPPPAPGRERSGGHLDGGGLRARSCLGRAGLAGGAPPDTPQGGASTAPMVLPPGTGFLQEKKNFFSQTKINKQKPQGSRAPSPAGLGPGLCFASKPKLYGQGQDPSPPGSPEAAGAVTPLPPGLGAEARASRPAPPQSSRPRSAGWACGAWEAACPCAPRGGGRGGLRRRPRPFHGALRGRGRKTPAGPRESRGWGEPRGGGWEGGRGGGGSPRGRGEGGAGIPPGGCE